MELKVNNFSFNNKLLFSAIVFKKSSIYLSLKYFSAKASIQFHKLMILTWHYILLILSLLELSFELHYYSGDPEVECGATGITVNFNTRNNFEGHVYVKGRYSEAGCRSDEGGRRVAGINLPFTQCGTERTRSLNPRGVFVRQSVVISFHPQVNFYMI